MIAYGRTPSSIAEEYGFPVADAVAMQKGWFAKYPVAAEFIQKARATPAQGIVQETPFGRRRRFGLITEDNAWNLENEAVNFPVQSTASDLTVFSAMELHSRLQGICKILVTVHDSILIEVPDEKVDEIIPMVLEVMSTLPTEKLNTDMPFVADVEVGASWGIMEKRKE